MKVHFLAGLCGDNQEALCQPTVPERKGIQDPTSFLGQQARYKVWRISQTTSLLQSNWQQFYTQEIKKGQHGVLKKASFLTATEKGVTFNSSKNT